MWKTVKLGDVCTVKTGKKDVNEGNPSGKYPFFTCAKEHTFSDVHSFDCEAILIAGNGAVGQTTYYKGKFEAYQRTYVLSEFHSILPKLLLLILQGRLMSHLSSMVLGNTIPYIKKGMLQNFEFPLPPLAEQQRIVAKLDAAFAEIDRAFELCKDKEAQSKQLLQRAIDDAFAFDAKTISFDSIVKDKGTGLERRANLQSADKQYPYFKMNNISSSNALEVSDFTAVDASDDEVAKYTLNEGDFLFNTRNSVELVGKTAVVQGIEGWLFNNNILRVKFMDEFNSNYVNDFFCSSEGKSQLEKRKTGTTNVAAIYFKDLKTVEIPFAKIELQRQIASKIAKARAITVSLQQNYRAKAEQLACLKSAILAQELQSPQSEAA